MNLPVILFCALVGWGGTRGPRPPGPREVIGAIVGAVSAPLVSLGFGFAAVPAGTELVVLAIGAFAASRLVTDVVDIVGGPRRPAEG